MKLSMIVLEKIFDFLKVSYHFANDFMLLNALAEDVKNIIGEKRFKDLERINKIKKVFTLVSGLGFQNAIFILPLSGDEEKAQIQTVFVNKIKDVLIANGYDTEVRAVWSHDETLNMPRLTIQFGEYQREIKALKNLIELENNKVLQQYQPLKDKELEELIDLHTQERKK